MSLPNHHKITVQGQYFRPLSSRSQTAELQVIMRDGGLRFCVFLVDGICVEDLVLDDMQGDDNLHFHGGGYFKTDQPLPVDFVTQVTSRTQRRIAWLEQFSLRKALVFAAILIVCVVGYRVALPFAVSGIVQVVPSSMEQSLGAHAYASARRIWFEPSELPQARRDSLRQKAVAMADAAGLDHRAGVLFYKSDVVGANAMAFPGGPIVVTDKLVDLLGADEEILAVLAHEMAHVEKRHSLQQMLNIVGATALASVVLGVDDGLMEELSAVIIHTWAFKNSRDFEKEADLKGLSILKARHIAPRHFLSAIQKLVTRRCQGKTGAALGTCEENAASQETGWMASHPGAKDRLEYLHQAVDGQAQP